MAKDGTTVAFGIIYLVLTGIAWLSLFLPFTYFTYHVVSQPFFQSYSGILLLFGCLLLIPSFILILIFIASDEGATTGKVGFGLGVPGWAFCLIGGVAGLATAYSIIIAPLLAVIGSSGLVVLGSLLLTRSPSMAPVPSSLPAFPPCKGPLSPPVPRA